MNIVYVAIAIAVIWGIIRGLIATSSSTTLKVVVGQPGVEYADDEAPWEEAGEESHVKKYSTAIPDGYQIFTGANVAGISFHHRDACCFANGHKNSIELEPEPTNKYSKNAIKIIGVSDGKRWMIGYVPRDTANLIARRGMVNALRPRLTRIYTGPNSDDKFPDPYLEIHVQLLGPKELKAAFLGEKPKPPRKAKTPIVPQTPRPSSVPQTS